MNTTAKKVPCTVCRADNLKTIVNLGLQPPANRFMNVTAVQNDQESFPLAFGYCGDCGTAQLTQRMPFEAIRPRFNWLLYNEPEGHLDAASQALAKLPGINGSSSVLGITYKDQSTIDRLARLGLPQGRYIDEKDFGFDSPLFGLETIQSLLRDRHIMANIKAKYGKANIVLMRHIVEHSDNAAELVLSLKELIAEGGYLVMELPDSDKILKAGNHPFIWEEHISYFTEKTLNGLASNVGAEVAWFERFSYPYEDSLMVAFRFPNAGSLAEKNKLDLTQVDNELSQFGRSFEDARQYWKETLTAYRNKGEKVAVFGAGHLSAKFINFFQLADLIDCVIDDNQNKAGMKMPGSLLPILPSSELAARGIKVCVSTLSPESEAKVRQKFVSYFADGGLFLPAFSIAK
jgi:hypothetical protein